MDYFYYTFYHQLFCFVFSMHKKFVSSNTMGGSLGDTLRILYSVYFAVQSPPCKDSIMDGYGCLCRGPTQMCLKACLLTQLLTEKQDSPKHHIFPAPGYRWEYEQTLPRDGNLSLKYNLLDQGTMKKQGKPVFASSQQLCSYYKQKISRAALIHTRSHPHPLSLLVLFTSHSLPDP